MPEDTAVAISSPALRGTGPEDHLTIATCEVLPSASEPALVETHAAERVRAAIRAAEPGAPPDGTPDEARAQHATVPSSPAQDAILPEEPDATPAEGQ